MGIFLIFDLSNLIFYRYYAIKKYFTIQKREIHTNEFKEKFLDFDAIINKIKKKFKLKNIKDDNILFLKDCKRANIWRNNYLKSYKQSRKYNEEIGEYFNLAYTSYFNNKNIIECEHAEADDICSVLVDYIINNIKYDNIFIFTNDQDYLQLIKNDNIFLFDMQLNNLINKSIGNYKDDLMYKCILGDKSDNISPITQRIGKKTALNYINNIKEFETYLENNKNIKNKYELNKLLIDLDNIPDELKQQIILKIKQAL